MNKRTIDKSTKLLIFGPEAFINLHKKYPSGVSHKNALLQKQKAKHTILRKRSSVPQARVSNTIKSSQ